MPYQELQLEHSESDTEFLYQVEPEQDRLDYVKEKLKGFLKGSPGIFLGLIVIIILGVLVAFVVRVSYGGFEEGNVVRSPLVHVTCGLVEGMVQGDVYVFKVAACLPATPSAPLIYVLRPPELVLCLLLVLFATNGCSKLLTLTSFMYSGSSPCQSKHALLDVDGGGVMRGIHVCVCEKKTRLHHT